MWSVIFNSNYVTEPESMRKMTWVHDEQIITICGTEKDITPKLMLKAAKFSVFLNAHCTYNYNVIMSHYSFYYCSYTMFIKTFSN